MAASFSVLLLLVVVSFFSSSRGAGQQYSFNRFSRTTGLVPDEKTDEVQTTQPEFYPESENPHGLTDNSAPPPPHTYTYTAPPPPKWLPQNYNKHYYVTDKNEVSPFTYQKEIIEDEKNDVPTFTTQSNSESEEEEEELDTTEFDDSSENKYTPSSSHAESVTESEEQQEKQEQQTDDQTTTYHQPPQKKRKQQRQGMSDTRFMANGKYAYNVETNTFTSEEHPYKLINSRNTYAKTNNFHKYNDPTGKTNAYAKQNYARQTYGEEFQTDDDEQP